MIKKLLTITSGVVLGSLLTTASLASTFAASEDCKNARTDVKAVIGVIQDCKALSSPWGCNSISHGEASACKRACAAVQDDICLYGSYPDPVSAGSMYEECDNCVETLCSPVVGSWTLSLQIGCGGNPIRGTVIFNGNSAWNIPGFINGGTWSQNYCDIEMVDVSLNPNVIWSATVIDTNQLSGTFTNGAGLSGCWTANRIPSMGSGLSLPASVEENSGGNSIY